MNGNGATAAAGTFADFVELLAAHINRPLDGVGPDDRLVEDLGLDSIAMLELFVLLEDAALHEVPVELVDSLETLGDVWEWHATLAAQGGGPGLPDGGPPRPR